MLLNWVINYVIVFVHTLNVLCASAFRKFSMHLKNNGLFAEVWGEDVIIRCMV